MIKKIIFKTIILAVTIFFLVVSVNSEIPEDTTEVFEDLSSRLLYGLERCEEKIDIRQYKVSIVEGVSTFRQLLEDQPQLYYVNGTFSYSYNAQGLITELFPSYRMDNEALTHSRSEVLDWFEAFGSLGRLYTSDADKALVIHDYLASHYTYSPAGAENYDIYSLITEGHGVCQSLSLAFVALGRYVGLEVDMVTSEAMDHAWNHVVIDGRAYHVDVTRDLPDEASDIQHEYFLVCDEAMMKRGYRDYHCASDHECKAHLYESPESVNSHEGMLENVEGSLLYLEPIWLGITADSRLVQWSFNNEKTAYPKECTDLTGDGKLSLSDMLLTDIQQASVVESRIADALRQAVMRRALEAEEA